MPALVEAGNYVCLRQWEYTSVLKPPEWREGVVAAKVHIGVYETFAAVRSSDHVQFLRVRRALVPFELPHVVFARQWGAQGGPEFLLWVM